MVNRFPIDTFDYLDVVGSKELTSSGLVTIVETTSNGQPKRRGRVSDWDIPTVRRIDLFVLRERLCLYFQKETACTSTK